MNLTDSEKEALKNANSQAEWDKITDKIVAYRNGNYPSDWHLVLFGKIVPKYLLNPNSQGEKQ